MLPSAPTSITKRCTLCGKLYPYNEAHTCRLSPAGGVPSAGAAQDLMVGAILGERYEILSRVSAGGMGVVYKARHIVLHSVVAVKILLKQDAKDAQGRFLQEARLASSIHHPNTVYISDFGVLDDGRSYLVMEFLEGKTLSQVIQRGVLEPLRACTIALQIAQGLQAVHEKGIVHRDLKPDNIFLIGKTILHEQVKIVDFGIALVAQTNPEVTKLLLEAEDSPVPTLNTDLGAGGARLTMPGMVMGTPQYMSPEQAEGGTVDARTDQYALGCILYEMLTGEVPFDDPRSVIKILHKHICANVIPPRQRKPGLQIPDALEALVLQMLAKQREDRLASMQELEQQLTRVLKSLRPKVSITPVETVRSAVVAQSGAPRVGRAQRLMVVLPLVAAVLGGGSYGVYRSLRSPVQGQRALDYTARLALRKQAIALLREQLADSDKRVRARAADALAHSGDTSVRTELEGLLNDSDPEVVGRAVDGLGRLGDRAAVSALVALQPRANGSALSLTVATALDRLGVPNQLELLQKVMRIGSGELRVRAAYLLTERGDQEARAQLHALVLARALPDAVQISVLAVLSQHGDADARAQLLAQLDGTRAEPEKLSLAAPLSRVGEERGTRYLQELARRPGPTQVLASRVLIAVGQATASDLEVLRSILQTPEASTAALLTAMDGIGEGGGDADLGLLAPLLKQKNARVSQAAAAAIVEITGRDPAALSEQSLQWAGAALGAPNWEMREAAVGMLGELRSGSVVSMLGKVVVQDAESRVRRGAAKALGQHESREAVNALRQALTDSDSSVRLETLTALLRLMTSLGSRADAELRQSVRSVLLSRLNKGSSQEQALISSSLLQLGDESQRAGLRQALTDADSAVRRIALSALDADTAALTTALTDNDPSLRLLAARRLAARGDAAGLAALRSLRDGGGRWGTEAYGVLRKLGDAGSPPSGLAKQLDGADKTQRLALLEAMAEMPAEESRPLLLRMLHDSDAAVRNQALTLLAQQPGSETLLRSLLKEEDPSLRTRAAALLLQRASAGTSVSAPIPPTPVAAVVKEPSVPVPAAVPATEPGVDSSQVTERAPDSGLVELQSAGLAALRRNDYSKAQKSFEKIVGMCGRKSQALGCGAVQTSAMFGLGQVYEAQNRAADAIAMYERTLSAQGAARVRSEDRARAQESMKRLTLQMGKIIVRKKEHNSCKSVTLWMSPGTHRINLGGNQMKWVPVQAGGSVEIDGCK